MYREQELKSLLEGRRILLAGYGREGRSTERMVRALLPEADISIADGNDQIRTMTAAPYDMIIKSPGVPMRLVKAQDPAVVTSQVDLFLQVYADRTIGVTGTKGKSTTASLIAHLLPDSILAGNIGIPMFDVIEQLDEQSTVVAELSCHQLEVLHRSPHIALVLNLFQEHLDHYKDYEAYKMAKMQIALHQQPDDHFFFCTDNEELRRLAERLTAELRGIQHPYSAATLAAEEQTLLESSPLLGEHNRSNALVACRIASLARRQPATSFRSRLSTFRGLRHRLEHVPGDRRGVIWYNDSISTIPEATIAALKALQPVGKVMTLILGGFDRGIDYAPLADYLVQENPVRNIAFVGAAGRRIHALLQESGYQCLCIEEDDYENIVPWCAKHTHRRSICLLSPAAASYDSFKNFEARGDHFMKLIQKLPGND
ncbi:MAG: UDP-N-acetylmuramoyl-L-alanine--D-glutamate ligase [Bacteroidales bacterium]|nr:UDP-N-acetylmuramoyl-L-alanine--D-glutamate ligase [Bacteroidales bacterium]